MRRIGFSLYGKDRLDDAIAYDFSSSGLEVLELDMSAEDYPNADFKKTSEIAKKYGIEDQVIIRGRIPHEEIPQFIDSLDIYVHPSFQEGLPRVIVEAISRGCPCLTSDVAGTPELIEESCLHHTGDVEKLCLDLHTFIENTELMKQAAVRNYNHAKQYYSDILDKKRSDFYTKFYKQQ